MAITSDKFLSGKVGPVIYYTRNGKQCVRGYKSRVKQTTATKASAKRFGVIKTLSRQLRRGWRNLFSNYKALKLMFRIDKAVAEWFNSGNSQSTGVVSGAFTNVNLFEGVNIKLKPEMNWASPGNVIVRLPAFKPKEMFAAPADTRLVRLHFGVAGCSQTLPVQGSRYHTYRDIRYSTKAVEPIEVKMPYDSREDMLSVVALSLSYYPDSPDSCIPNWDDRWKAAMILGAWNGGRKTED